MDDGISELKIATNELKRAIDFVRERGNWTIPQQGVISLPPDATGWNFKTFEIYINQRFSDLSLQLRERYETQQTGVTAALTAAEKAVNAALVAAEKAINKAEYAQQLRNEAQNEFRKSLSDLSALMWTIKEGTSAVDAVRRELNVVIKNLEDRIGLMESTINNKWSMSDGLSSLDSLRREWNAHNVTLESRTSALELGYANIQGRIWAVSGIFSIIVLAIEFGLRFVGHQ